MEATTTMIPVVLLLLQWKADRNCSLSLSLNASLSSLSNNTLFLFFLFFLFSALKHGTKLHNHFLLKQTSISIYAHGWLVFPLQASCLSKCILCIGVDKGRSSNFNFQMLKLGSIKRCVPTKSYRASSVRACACLLTPFLNITLYLLYEH